MLSLCFKENATSCSDSDTSPPPSPGPLSSQGKEHSGHWLRIKLLFLHENVICIAFQINMSAKLPGRRLDERCLLTSPGIPPSSTGSVQQVLIGHPLKA